MKRVFVSTGGFREKTPSQSVQLLLDAGINTIELSGGKFQKDLRSALQNLKHQCTFQIHNYFPPPEIPFVLNLATVDRGIGDQCMDMVASSMGLAAGIGTSRYSVHAGFRMDPVSSELGTRVPRKKLRAKQEALDQFMERISLIAALGRDLDVEILIENNVLSAENYKEFGENPFLGVTPEEVKYLMNHAPAKVGFLLDVAHWNVSAKTLGRNPEEMFEICAPWIRGCHLSENDGTQDSNEPIREDSWFWEKLPKNLPFYTLEIYNTSPQDLRSQIEITERIIL